MSRWTLRARPAAVLCSIAAIAAAGCGSSSSSKVKPASPAAANPATRTQAIPATPSTTTSTPSAGVNASTPITSPAFRAGLIQGEQTTTPLKEPQLGQLADCSIKKFQEQGLKTAGQVQQLPRSAVLNIGHQCAQELGLHYSSK